MRIPLGIFLLFVCTCCSTNVFASDGCGAGKYKDETTQCANCKTGYYCPDDENPTQQCPSDYPNSYPGKEFKKDCYNKCMNFITDESYYAIDSASFYAYYDTNCQYTADHLACNPGYAKNPQISSNDKVTTDNNKNICLQNIPCDKAKLPLCSYGNGKINGTANAKQDTSWDYSRCTCTIANAFIANGTATKECKYNKTNWQDTNDCTIKEVTSCDAGYCQTDDDAKACAQAPKGYYSPDKSMPCKKCPIGSTTDGGAKNITDCYITSGTDGTKFCDNQNNCFTLPGTDKIYANES